VLRKGACGGGGSWRTQTVRGQRIPWGSEKAARHSLIETIPTGLAFRCSIIYCLEWTNCTLPVVPSGKDRQYNVGHRTKTKVRRPSMVLRTGSGEGESPAFGPQSKHRLAREPLASLPSGTVGEFHAVHSWLVERLRGGVSQHRKLGRTLHYIPYEPAVINLSNINGISNRNGIAALTRVHYGASLPRTTKCALSFFRKFHLGIRMSRMHDHPFK
jgi:hypothetical protein